MSILNIKIVNLVIIYNNILNNFKIIANNVF